MTLKDLGAEAPADYRAYMELGRFRDALVLHEIAKGNGVEGLENLKKFVANYKVP